MNVELPDGTVIEDVPDGMSRNDLLKKLYYSKNPEHNRIAHQLLEHDLKTRGWGSGLPKVANQAGGAVTDLATRAGASPETAAGAGYVTNIGAQAIPAFLGSFRFSGEAPTSVLERPARWLMQSAIKPTQADRASGAAKEAMGTMLQENISPTAGGMDKAQALARALDKQAEAAVAASPAQVSLNAVGQRLQEPARRAINQVNPQGDIEVVKSVWQNFKDSPLIQALTRPPSGGGTSNLPVPAGAAQVAAQDVSIPVQLAHELKKGTYASLGGKAYGEVGSVSTEAQKALARGLREEVAAAVPAAAEALKREASLMNVKDVAMNRVLGEANKNPMGLAALRIGDNPLSSVAFLADRSAYLKGLLARVLYRGGQPQLGVPYGETVEDIKQQQQQ